MVTLVTVLLALMYPEFCELFILFTFNSFSAIDGVFFSYSFIRETDLNVKILVEISC